MSSHRSTAGTVLLVLFVFWPFVLAAVVLLVFAAVFFGAIVVQAFQEGFAEGCASLAALIGIPSIGLLWLSAALKLFGRKAPVAPSTTVSRFGPSNAERYASGDFEHRDYEDEKAEWEAFWREKGW